MKEIELSKQGKHKGKYKVLVDNDVFDIVNRYRWHYSNGYARNSKMNILLHRFIWELKNGEIPSGLEVEHIDENGLNCCLSNLRLANSSENKCNVSKRKDNKSGYKGVFKYTQRYENKDGSISIYEKWRAKITKDKKIYAEYFDYTAEGLQNAVEWYKNMSLKLQGEFSIYNKPNK